MWVGESGTCLESNSTLHVLRSDLSDAEFVAIPRESFNRWGRETERFLPPAWQSQVDCAALETETIARVLVTDWNTFRHEGWGAAPLGSDGAVAPTRATECAVGVFDARRTSRHFQIGEFDMQVEWLRRVRIPKWDRICALDCPSQMRIQPLYRVLPVSLHELVLPELVAWPWWCASAGGQFHGKASAA